MRGNEFAIKRKKRGTIALLVFMTVLLLAGCGTNGSKSGGAASDKPEASPSPSAAASAEKRTIKHAMGETPVPAAPKKVVVLTNEGTEAMLALGIKPVGAVKSFTGNPWYDHIKADMEGVTVLGEESQPNLELIASLKPDLILGNKLRQEKIYEQLNAIAPTVFSETLRGSWKINFSLYADALNKKAEGDKVIRDFDNRIADFQKKAGDKLKQTVSVVRFMAGKTRIYYEDTFTGIIFKQIGIARPARTSKETFADDVTKERIPEMEADMMFYFTYDTGDGKATAGEKEWTSEPLWQNLKVVKNQKAYRVSDAIWNTAGGVRAANLMLDELYGFYQLQK